MPVLPNPDGVGRGERKLSALPNGLVGGGVPNGLVAVDVPNALVAGGVLLPNGIVEGGVPNGLVAGDVPNALVAGGVLLPNGLVAGDVLNGAFASEDVASATPLVTMPLVTVPMPPNPAPVSTLEGLCPHLNPAAMPLVTVPVGPALLDAASPASLPTTVLLTSGCLPADDACEVANEEERIIRHT